MTMKQASQTRILTRNVPGTTFCAIGSLKDVIAIAEQMRAIAKQNPKHQEEAPKELTEAEKSVERRYLFSVASSRLADAAQCEIPSCAEDHSFDDYRPAKKLNAFKKSAVALRKGSCLASSLSLKSVPDSASFSAVRQARARLILLQLSITALRLRALAPFASARLPSSLSSGVRLELLRSR